MHDEDLGPYPDWDEKKGRVVVERTEELYLLGLDGEPLTRVNNPIGFKLGKKNETI